MNKFTILSLTVLLGACATTPDQAPDVAIQTRTVERLVPVLKPCEVIVTRPDEALARDASGLEDKIDRQIESDSSLRNYIGVLEQGLVTCGGTIEDETPGDN